MTVAAPRPVAARQSLADRVLAAAPLLSIFVWLLIIYGIEAWAHASPWLFGDELELTQLSRSIAATGHAARRGQPHSFDTLYTYLTAPAWLIHDTHRAYETIKYIGVLAMTLTIFPAYGLARTIVGRWPALFVAAASAAIPSLAYSAFIAQETVAYPYSTLCLFLIVRALLTPTRWWLGGAVVASIVAPFVRDELRVIPALFVLAALFLLWRSAAVERWRKRWSRWDWAGLVILVTGAAIATSAVLGHSSTEWLIATGFYKHRMFTLGLRAAGALTIGLGVLPVIAGLASLWRAPGEPRTPELTVFRSVLLASLVGFGLYTAAKAAYVSTTFGTYTVERNLIYLSPLLFLGTALWLERRAFQPLAVAVAALVALYLILTTPYEMGQSFYSQAPGFSILQRGNRLIALTPSGAKIGLVCMIAASAALLVLPRFLGRRRSTLRILTIAIGLFVFAWNGTGELSAAAGSRATADSFLTTIREPATWVDDHTGGAPALYLGQQIQDPNSEQLLEFWNRSILRVWSLDGTAPGPGPTLTPDLRATDGLLQGDPGYAYAVTEEGIDIVGTPIARHEHSSGGGLRPWTLYRIDHPLRLRGAVIGLFADGWSGPNDTAYTRYSTAAGRAGTVIVGVSRRQWGGPDKPGKVRVVIGTLAIGPDSQPAIGRVTDVRTWVVHSNQERSFRLRAPGPRFRVEVHVDPKFVPQELSPQTTSDRRQLGAVVTFRFRGSPRRGR